MKPLLLALVILLPVAKVARVACRKIRTACCLGGALGGHVLGNLSLVGLHAIGVISRRTSDSKFYPVLALFFFSSRSAWIQASPIF